MMGRQHALCGLIAGVGYAAAIPTAPVVIRGLVVVVTGGAALLPDLDHPSATAARSLGLLTKVIALGVDKLSINIYHATRGPRDTPERISGHRAFTHTIPACAGAAAIVGLLVLFYPPAVAIVCGLLAGLLALGVRVAGLTLMGSTFAVALWTLWERPGWSWVFPVAVFVGCVVHICGDAVTNSGVPLLWPILRDGKRWGTIRTPVTFAAGDHIEHMLIAPALLLTLAASTAWVTGLLTALVTAAGSS